MKKILYIVFAIMIAEQLAGCGNIIPDFDSKSDTMESDSELLTKSLDENMEVEYVSNKDGTYTCEGKIYHYKLTLTGKGNGSEKMSQCIVLTNDSDLSFEDVFNSQISSVLSDGEPDYVLLGLTCL